MSGNLQIPLTLGTFLFDEYQFETPETIGDLGGTQIVQQHDFPGGIRTQQVYGYFPSPVRWRGRFSGGMASDRVEQVKRILHAGTEVTLTWGERSWVGLLRSFTPTAHHTWLFDYECEFWPREDLSSGHGESSGAISPELVLDLQLLSLAGWLNTSGHNLVGLAVMVLLGPISGLLSAVNFAMSLAQGVVRLVTNLEALAVVTAATTLATLAGPFCLSDDPLEAAPAWDIYSSAMVVRNVFTNLQAPKWVIHVVNPNLMALSAQYYGDAGQWRTIASVNGLSDPQPIGEFELLIPGVTAG